MAQFQKGSTFPFNNRVWEILEMEGTWVLCKGQQMVPSSSKPMVTYDCGNLRVLDGDHFPAPTLGLTDTKDNLSLELTRERWERGRAKLLDNKVRAAKTLEEKRSVQLAEQKRQDFISQSEESKHHLLSELHDLYDKSDSWAGIGKNARAKQILAEVAAISQFQYFWRHTIHNN